MHKRTLRASMLAVFGLASVCGQVSAAPYVVDPVRGSTPPPADQIARGGVSAAQVVENGLNGSFEINGGVGTAEFDSWTVINVFGEEGEGEGKQGNTKGQQMGVTGWQVQTGSTSPLVVNAFAVNPPTDGQFAAMTDQTGPSAHILYQDIEIPPGGATIAFDLFLSNQAVDYFVPDPATLDPDVPEENQQFRADLIDPSADIFDVGGGVVQNLYQTLPGDDLVSGYDRIVSVVPGNGVQRTLRLRFAVTNNEFFFNVGVDNLVVISNGRVVPANGPGWLLALGLLLGTAGLLAARRRFG